MSVTHEQGTTTMTDLLLRAFDAAAQLPTQEQDALAALILEELAEERRWNESFARSPELLERLANEALAEYEAGETELLDPDSL